MQQLSPDELTVTVRPTRLDATGDEGPGAAVERRRSWLSKNLRFLVCVVLPTALAIVYFGLLASKRYETEVKFVVRTQLSSAAGQLTSMMQGSNIVRSADDAHVVHAYMKSRTALRELLAEVPLLDMTSRAGTDLLWWYPLPFLPHNEQRLHNHLQRFIDLHYDQSTGISTLRVQAFAPEDAATLAAALVRNSEKLLNRLNDRVLQDSLDIARKEVELSRTAAVDKQLEMTDFRMRSALVDPVKASGQAHETIGKLSLEAAQVKAQVAELQKTSPQSAQIPLLLVRIKALEEQIRQSQLQLAGSENALAPRLAEYERYLMYREFAERSFVSAMTALELARSDAQRQKLYLDMISKPLPADYHKYPSRVLSILIAAAFGYAVFSILGGTKKH